MTNFTKVVLKIVAGMSLAGVICLCIGGLGNGFNKIDDVGIRGTEKIFKYHFSKDDIGDFEDATKLEAGKTMEYTSSDLRNLEFNLGAGEYEIVPSENGKVVITNNTKLDLESGLEDGTLYVGIENRSHITYDDKNKVTIALPEGISYDSVYYNLGAGDFSQKLDIECNNFDLEVGAGKVYIQGLNANDLNVELGAGDITLYDAYAKMANFEIGMGNMTYNGDVSGDMEIDCSMGSVFMELFSLEEDHNIDYEISAGNFNYGHKSYSGIGYHKVNNNDAESNYEITCSMGNITIDFNEAI